MAREYMAEKAAGGEAAILVRHLRPLAPWSPWSSDPRVQERAA
ncbi:MAG TPA: hypothetical protein VHZ02_15135 [Acidimicrobiales bacterium]|nr:hypothetical protein [Acidimicrobiales bacterium]